MLQYHPKALLISESVAIPVIIHYDDNTDTTHFIHQDSGKEIDVIDYCAERFPQNHIIDGAEMAEVIPAVLSLYDQTINQPECQICYLEDVTEYQNDRPLDFIVAVVRRPEELAHHEEE